MKYLYKKIHMNRNRFFVLLESKLGNVKPLILEDSVLPEELWWQSCDRKMNKLLPQSRELLKKSEEKPREGSEFDTLYYFTQVPEDKTESGLTAKECLGVESPKDLFYIEKIDNMMVLRYY